MLSRHFFVFALSLPLSLSRLTSSFTHTQHHQPTKTYTPIRISNTPPIRAWRLSRQLTFASVLHILFKKKKKKVSTVNNKQACGAGIRRRSVKTQSRSSEGTNPRLWPTISPPQPCLSTVSTSSYPRPSDYIPAFVHHRSIPTPYY